MADNKEDLVKKIQFETSPEFHEKVKQAAVARNLTIGALAENAIRAYLPDAASPAIAREHESIILDLIFVLENGDRGDVKIVLGIIQTFKTLVQNNLGQSAQNNPAQKNAAIPKRSKLGKNGSSLYGPTQLKRDA